MTNCINCGAILSGSKCEYCGTEYNNSGISAGFEKDDYFGIMKIGDEEIQVYIGSMEANLVCGDSYRDSSGALHRDKPMMKRKFTLIEI